MTKLPEIKPKKIKNEKSMKKINNWLKKFTAFWKTRDIDGVMDLFTDNVEYWETPFSRISNPADLRREWENIKNQNNIAINCKVFSKENNKYTIFWDLRYTNTINQPKHYKGTYLLRLNLDNKCNYFFHCGESRI